MAEWGEIGGGVDADGWKAGLHTSSPKKSDVRDQTAALVERAHSTLDHAILVQGSALNRGLPLALVMRLAHSLGLTLVLRQTCCIAEKRLAAILAQHGAALPQVLDCCFRLGRIEVQTRLKAW